MVDIMHELGVSAAVLGNHEFDFGIPSLKENLELMNFPWLCSNITDVRTNNIVAATINKNGKKTGIRKTMLRTRTTSG